MPATRGARRRFLKEGVTIPVDTGGDPKRFVEVSATATFDAPGESIIRAQVNDA